MTELFLTLLLGILFGYLIAPKQKELKHQIEIYQERIVVLHAGLEYYKRMCKKIAEENAEFRREK